MTIRVTAARGSSTVSFSTNGRYVSFTTAGYQRQLLGQPVQPTASLDVFWASILAAVQSSLTMEPDPP
jgi:hypothetical protein